MFFLLGVATFGGSSRNGDALGVPWGRRSRAQGQVGRVDAPRRQEWLIKELGSPDCVAKHVAACSTALDKTAAFGIDSANVFGFWDSVRARARCPASNTTEHLGGRHVLGSWRVSNGLRSRGAPFG